MSGVAGVMRRKVLEFCSANSINVKVDAFSSF
ncbi:hypothetical protein P4S64_11885 [Vibrio sp. M60_M31a]